MQPVLVWWLLEKRGNTKFNTLKSKVKKARISHCLYFCPTCRKNKTVRSFWKIQYDDAFVSLQINKYCSPFTISFVKCKTFYLIITTYSLKIRGSNSNTTEQSALWKKDPRFLERKIVHHIFYTFSSLPQRKKNTIFFFLANVLLWIYIQLGGLDEEGLFQSKENSLSLCFPHSQAVQ